MTSGHLGGWQEFEVSGRPHLIALAYGQGTFVAVGYDLDVNQGRVFQSTDGKTWTDVSPAGLSPLRDVIWAEQQVHLCRP